MAKLVREIMNPELYSVGPNDSVERVLDGLLGLGITAAPVLDDRRRPVGVIALRDIARAHSLGLVRERMSGPPAVISREAPIEEAGRLLAETGYRHVVVVDQEGHAVGMISALDALRGVMGLPTRHPDGFPHLDLRTGLAFTNEAPLDMDHLDEAPDGPGVLAIIHGEAGVPDRIVWVESANNVRARLVDLLSTTHAARTAFAKGLDHSSLRFRAAPVADRITRARAVGVLRASATGPRPPGA